MGLGISAVREESGSPEIRHLPQPGPRGMGRAYLSPGNFGTAHVNKPSLTPTPDKLLSPTVTHFSHFSHFSQLCEGVQAEIVIPIIRMEKLRSQK